MEAEEHVLSLKGTSSIILIIKNITKYVLLVMRLTRPTLASCLPVTCDSKDLPGNLLNNALQQDSTSVEGTETLAIGQFLLLPQTPVNIYLGETFSSYVCVYSSTQEIVNNITVKVLISAFVILEV